MPNEQKTKITEPLAKFHAEDKISLPDWVPEDFRKMAEMLAEKRGIGLNEYLTWLWNNTTTEEAEKYREIAETFVKILILHEELSELLAIQRAEISHGKEELNKMEKLINRAQSLIQQAEKYSEQGQDEKADELFKQVNRLLEFTSLQLAVEKESCAERDKQVEELNTELNRLTQKLLELTNGGDDLLNTAKLYTFLEVLPEVSR